MSMSTNEWMVVSWINELNKNQILLKKEGENTVRRVNKHKFYFNVMVGNEFYTEWKMAQGNMKNITKEVGNRKKRKLCRKDISK